MNERMLRVLLAVLALAGAAIAGYLTYTHFEGTSPVCLTSGCEVVQNSRWSELLGIPIALLGLLAYLSIFASTLARHPLARMYAAAAALAALGFNIYLLYIQAYEIGRYCTWCVSNEIVSAVLTPVAFAWLVVGSRADAEGTTTP